MTWRNHHRINRKMTQEKSKEDQNEKSIENSAMSIIQIKIEERNVQTGKE